MIWEAIPGSRRPAYAKARSPNFESVRGTRVTCMVWHVVADDRRPQRVVAVATACTVSERYDGDLIVVNVVHQCAKFKLHS